MYKFAVELRAAWYSVCLPLLPRRLTRHFSNLALYFFFAVFFVIGYYIGIAQNISFCSKICLQELHTRGELKLEKSLYQSFLVVLIFSAPRNANKRNTIRETWLSLGRKNSVSHFFVIGTASLEDRVTRHLKDEAHTKRDLLLLENVNDSYSKLSKKLLDALKWVDVHVNYTFLLKVDDDSFVKLDSLFTLLHEQAHKTLYWGFFDGRSPIHRKGKWFEDKWNLCDTYLPYAKGGGYILTSDLVRYVSINADLFTLYKSEDVSLGVWLAPLNIEKKHDPNFDTEYRSRGCFNSYLVTHKQTETMMVMKHKNLITSGNICPVEQRSRLSYVYNWKVLPSLCCIRNNSEVP